MLVVRDVFQARYGRGDELVALFKEIEGVWAKRESRVKTRSMRLMTDASGPFFTVVTEIEVDSFAAWEQLMAEEFSLPEFPGWFARMTPLVESGRREFYNLVA